MGKGRKSVEVGKESESLGSFWSGRRDGVKRQGGVRVQRSQGDRTDLQKQMRCDGVNGSCRPFVKKGR